MQQEFFCRHDIFSNYGTKKSAGTMAKTLAGLCFQGIVLSVALPLACLLFLLKGLGMGGRFLANCSFVCFVWVVLGCAVLLFLLLVGVHLFLASVG